LIVDVVIPALDESLSLPLVLADLPRALVRHVVVADNGSTDGTGAVAAAAGCVVAFEPRRGYGSACLAGLAWLRASSAPPEVVVFLDADHSDHADELPSLLAPIAEGRADLVVGSRATGIREQGALLPQQRVGNAVAALLIRALYGASVTDLGPFRAIRWEALERIGMADRGYGWTAEMQVKAFAAGLRYAEVPVSYRRRVGRSKIAGTLRGTVGAGIKIVATILRHARRG
jgi:glycosyltransferase involved in cell wall biosynthesis